MREKTTNRTKPEAEWQVIPRIQRHENGDTTVRLDFECDCSKSRPAWWTKLPSVLSAHGFELDPLFDGSDESLCPTTFFSATVLIVARKTYAYSASMLRAVRADVSRLTDFLGQHRATETNRLARKVAA